MAAATTTSAEAQVQVRLKTVEEKYAVPDTTLTVPASVTAAGLTTLVKDLLTESSMSDDDLDLEGVDFDFILLDELVRGSLADVLATKEDVVSSSEAVVEVTYIEKLRPPEPKKSVNHDDWVAGVSCQGKYVLSACYDNTVAIWDKDSGAKLLTIPGHAGPCRSVAWIDVQPDDQIATFASTSHDQTVLLHQWNIPQNSIEVVNACKGHERSVDCVAVDPSKSLLASGSFDTNLKIWGASLQQRRREDDDDDDDQESESKRAKSSTNSKTSSSSAVTRTPVMTLAGHKEGISGVSWLGDKTSLVSASWDHTLRIWDTEMGGMKAELVGNKSFFDVSYSASAKLLITAAAERSIRLYDPNSKDGLLVKSAYTSHQGWVTCVDWCAGSDTHFVSGSHDMVLKMWDVRSFKTPLFDLSGHSDRILCANWSQPDVVVSGGADNDMKIFKANLAATMKATNEAEVKSK